MHCAEAARAHNVPVKTAQRWCKLFRETGEVEVPENVNGSEPVQILVLDLIDEKPTARMADVVDAKRLCTGS